MVESYNAKLQAPFAVLGVQTQGEKLCGIEYLPVGVATMAPVDPFSREVCRQLRAYLDDPDFRFDLPFAQRGTEFQQRVWDVISAIPRGETMSYLAVAREVRSAPRAVGNACGANRVPLLVPCHRVVGSGGLGGFMHSRGGQPLRIKRWLLNHEGALD